MRNRKLALMVVLAGMVALVPAAPGASDVSRRANDGAVGARGGLVAAAVVSQNLPIATWTLPAQAYDGIGSWMVLGNVPTAGAGQVAPAYAMVHEFDFINHPEADALVMLGIDGGARFAEFIVYWNDGRILEATMPFEWQPYRWYFPFVYKAAEGIWAAFVYDLTAATSTYIGSHVVPAEWGAIDRETYLYVDWFGDPPATCAGYPHADVYRMAPTGYVGQVASQSSLTTTTNITGTCPGTVASYPDANWSHFLMG
jgi:hypothetical protein